MVVDIDPMIMIVVTKKTKIQKGKKTKRQKDKKTKNINTEGLKAEGPPHPPQKLEQGGQRPPKF